MKVRHKLGCGPDYEVVEGLVVKDLQGIIHIVDKNCFEEIPTEPRWQDVTGECSVANGTILHDNAVYLTSRVMGIFTANEVNKGAYLVDGYRLRKVRVVQLTEENNNEWVIRGPGKAQDAFLVERKVE